MNNIGVLIILDEFGRFLTQHIYQYSLNAILKTKLCLTFIATSVPSVCSFQTELHVCELYARPSY